MLKRTAYSAVLVLVLICAFGSSAGAQQPSPALAVTGDVRQPLTLTAADLAKMPRTAVNSRNNTAAWGGVLLSEILKRAGVPLGTELRGTALTTYVVVSASDGYQVLFSLGELDPDMTDAEVLVAAARDPSACSQKSRSFRCGNSIAATPHPDFSSFHD
jgi:hypothetical protein